MLTTSLTLLAQLRQPNQPEAWARFINLYTPLLLRWAKRQQFQEAEAQDLVQEVLVQLLRQLPDYQQGAGQSFRSWLCRVVATQCRDFCRRKAARPLPQADGPSGVDERSPLPELETAEYRRLLVRRGLHLIRPDFDEATWAAFTKGMLEGQAPVKVAVELNISASAVFVARHRVLARLRQELDGLLD
jgi:RNA polymerase sigma-70 factor (ECF subfamily)